jgi:hypothetical protein
MHPHAPKEAAMCHLASHRVSATADATETGGPTPSRGLRPRRAAGAAIVAIAGLATAALIDRDTPRNSRTTEMSSVGAAAATAATPLVPVSEPPMRGALLPDDDVPTTTGSSKPLLGHCDHGA